MFFMLRASEYLVQDHRSWSKERVLHGDDMAPKLHGLELASFKKAEEVVYDSDDFDPKVIGKWVPG